MPQKSPGTSYSGKPVRRLKLPKIGPTKAKSLFEEYFYILLAVVFLGVSILGIAGGFSTYNALLVGAWVTGLIWFVSQWKGYQAEKEKAGNGKSLTPPVAAPAEAPKGSSPLPPGMKPMIGPQWPVKAGGRTAWPRLAKEAPPTDGPAPASQTPVHAAGVPAPAAQTEGINSGDKKRSFVYERPTLPDRKPKLPNNWADPNNKNLNNKKPKR